VIVIRRGSDRAVTHGPGITTWHSFSSGAHYDAANVRFGELVTCDEHLLAPGAGFSTHAHRGLEIVTWVLDGTLEHADSLGGRATVRPGTVAHLSAGSGVEHAERNGGRDELRFVQMWLLGDTTAAPAYRTGSVELPGVSFDVVSGPARLAAAPYVHAFVASGTAVVAGTDLAAGGDARITDEAVEVAVDGELIVSAMLRPIPASG
jgi:redox-sensitive bicupin YhaK (pirin superfamily)